MAGQSDNMIAWEYTCDDNTTKYRLRAKKALTDQLDGGNVMVGGQAATASIALPPQGFRPRKVYVTGGTPTAIRTVVAYAPGAPILTAGKTISIQHKGDATVFTSGAAVLGERKRLGIVDSA